VFAITSSATNLQEDTVLNDDQEIAVGSIVDSADLMMRLVCDVLDLSKIDAGKLQLEHRAFSLRRLLHNLRHTIQNQVRTKHGEGVLFTVRQPDDLPDQFRSDQTRLLQIIYNLLSNSIKFTNSGTVELDIRVDTEYMEQQQQNPQKLQVWARKNGITKTSPCKRSYSFLAKKNIDDVPDQSDPDGSEQEFST
jgi:signal transduction histidine kinase